MNICIVLCIEMGTLNSFNRYFFIAFEAWYIDIYLLMLFFNNLKMAIGFQVEILFLFTSIGRTINFLIECLKC